MTDNLVSLVFTLLAGLCFGSLVTLLSYRLPLEEDVVVKPSRCPKCDAKLRIRDLFPVLSWVMLRGRCYNCFAPISLRYPLTELATASGFLLSYHLFGFTPLGGVMALVWAALMLMMVVDLEHYIIPDTVHVVLIALGIAYHVMMNTEMETAMSGFLTGALIGIALRYGYAAIRRKEGMGMGDVKFLAVAGLWLGVKTMVPFLFLSGVLGIVTGLIWRVLKRGPIFPFAPSLGLAFYANILFPQIANLFWKI